MSYAPTMGISRVRDGSTWVSVAIVIAIHALLFAWLLSLRWSAPLRQAVADMILVELSATPETPLGDKKSGIVAPSPKPNSSTGHAHASSAAPHRELTPKDLENRVITREGVAAPGSAAISLAPSNPVDGNAVAGLGQSHGTEAAAGGGDGAHARGRFHPPEVVRRFRPDYPLDAFQARQQGVVDVMVTIGMDNKVKEAHVFQSSGNASLDRVSVEAVRSYVFRAARRDSDLVEAQAIVSIEWTIMGSGGANIADSRPR